MKLVIIVFSICAVLPYSALAAQATPLALPVRGLHLSAPTQKDLPALLDFITHDLPKEGVNTLILEFDYNFDFTARPGFTNATALGQTEVRQLAQACRDNRIELIPQLNCLGHQSWAGRNSRLLEVHPEFDETPGKYPGNKDIYCRSYCPLHPQVHQVLFALIDELATASQAKSVHVGMDEVFILGDADCPRCRDKTAAELFAGEVKMLHDHLASIGCRTWMWADRFIDGKATGIGKWEASENGTQSAIDVVPKDIVLCDWHYEKAPDTPRVFASKGFDVVSCPWRKPAVALAELQLLQSLASNEDPAIAKHALGMLQTTWGGLPRFVAAYRALQSGAPLENNSASESAHCFLTLFKNMREQ